MNRSFQDLLYPPYWQQLNLDQRVGLLQDLENDQARQTGRDRCTVVAEKMPELGNCGFLHSATRTIKINADHIQNDALEFSAVHTLLHEGRHAYQQNAIKTHGLHHDPEQVRVWTENHAVYVQNSEKSFFIYRNQPVEKDADDYANGELKRIFDRLERTHGTIDLCRRHAGMMEAEAKFVAEKSREKYGADFEAKITKAIRQAYQIKKDLNGEKTPEKSTGGLDLYHITINSPGTGDLTKTLAVDRALPVAEKEAAIKKAARDFICQSANRSEDLNSMQVRIERVGDHSEGHLREAFRQIGHQGHEHAQARGIERAR